ncbi:MAG TPA: toxin TcdB middle/N-terminal domain-containing protein, partial [Spirochaetota bacterium]|nr:toxin TcdB middle/N-terminal domain-containing protein [Spirochaetota bacterium]
MHRYTTQYEYTNGVQDRKNREFLGFGMVVEKRADGSTVEKYFHTDSYYTKGLMQKEVMKDAGGHVYVQKDYTYAMRAIVPVKGLWLYEVQYPHVTDEKATYYEGRGGMGVIHQQHYQYDDYGNVTQYTDAGSPDTASDDVTAIIQYYYLTGSYIMDRPAQIVVQDAAGKPYRYRIGTYNSKGQLVKLRIKNSSGDFAITDIG